MRATITVHGFDQAVAALRAAESSGRDIVILSAAGAARAAGAGWWRELSEQAAAAVPECDADWVLDCADEAGMALAALREGVRAIALEADDATRRRVTEIAARSGAALVRIDRAGALDLARTNNPQQECARFLANTPDGVAKPRALG